MQIEILISIILPQHVIKYNRDRGMAQLASALAWGARGRQCKPDYPDKHINRIKKLKKYI